MASMRSPSVQERLRAAKAERVLKHAREQRLESLAKRRAMDDIETNVRTQLDYVYDIKPPTIKNFTPTKTHRTKRMKDKWSGHMKTAASHGRRISAAALLAEEKDNLLSLVRAKATAKTTAAVTAAAAAAVVEAYVVSSSSSSAVAAAVAAAAVAAAAASSLVCFPERFVFVFLSLVCS